MLFNVHGKHLCGHVGTPPKQLTSTSCSNWQLPFLNQWKEKRKYMAGPVIEPGTSGSWVRRATDCATRPGWNNWLNFINVAFLQNDRRFPLADQAVFLPICLRMGGNTHWQTRCQEVGIRMGSCFAGASRGPIQGENLERNWRTKTHSALQWEKTRTNRCWAVSYGFVPELRILAEKKKKNIGGPRTDSNTVRCLLWIHSPEPYLNLCFRTLSAHPLFLFAGDWSETTLHQNLQYWFSLLKFKLLWSSLTWNYTMFHIWFNKRSGLEVTKLFSCSTQLGTKFFLLIIVKMPTIVGILTCMSRKNSILGLSEPEKCWIPWYFHTCEQLKFLSWAWNKFYNLGARFPVALSGLFYW